MSELFLHPSLKRHRMKLKHDAAVGCTLDFFSRKYYYMCCAVRSSASIMSFAFVRVLMESDLNRLAPSGCLYNIDLAYKNGLRQQEQINSHTLRAAGNGSHRWVAGSD